MRISKTPRRGFTLVEVLVAAGLCMLIMAVITQAFQRGMDTLSQLKSVGELQQRLRSFENVMRTDLESDHFDSRYGPKLSDQKANLLTGVTDNERVEWRPPTLGFFSIRQGATSAYEGWDNDGVVSTKATSHVLHMTVRRSGARSDKNFSTALSPNMSALSQQNMQKLSMNQVSVQNTAFVSDWAEVAYFLDTTVSLGATPGGTPLYGLYRRTRVIANSGDPAAMSWTAATTGGSMNAREQAQCLGVSFSPQSGAPATPALSPPPPYAVEHAMNTPREIRIPRNRLGGLNQARTGLASYDNLTAENDGTGNYTGADLLLSDVISFEIKADWDGGSAAPGGTNARESLSSTYEFPFSDLPQAYDFPASAPTGVLRNSAIGAARIFDTWFDNADGSWLKSDATYGSTNVIPQLMRVRAIQIKVRVWDRKNNMARQITIVQDL